MKDFHKLKLLVFCVFLPTVLSINIGILRLSSYRIVLLLYFIQTFFKVCSSINYKKDSIDAFMFLYAIWAFIALGVNHGTSVMIESGGVFFLESLGPFFLVKLCINDQESLDKLIKLLRNLVVLLLFVTIPEMITGINWLFKIVYPIMGSSFVNITEKRLGLTRAYGAFDHPIINGVICSSVIGFAFFEKKTIDFKKIFYPVLATITSLSSGAISSIMVQFILVLYHKFTNNIKNRWRILFIIVFVVYILIDILSTRTPLKVLFTYLTFSPKTGYDRLLIWEYGFPNAIDNPFFGIGFSNWNRPEWFMHDGSIDNFWLVTMMRYGFPAFIFLILAVITTCYRLLKLKVSDSRLNSYRRGWLVGMMGLFVSGCTVHYWNQVYVYLMLYISLGSSLLKILEQQKLATDGNGITN